jgi:D-alanyl-D-alanine carboxypeptidase (penicillin-binding protein 5/6)
MSHTADKLAFGRLWAALVVVAIVASILPSVGWAEQLSSDLVDGTTAAKHKLDLATLPDMTVQEGALVDGDGRVLWARTPDVRRPMASITKIMTAVVALEHSSLTDVVTVPREAVKVGQSSAGLIAGEKLTMQELLQALLVKSGNDAAVTIADHVGGSQAGFVAMMNSKAVDLGLKDTHYANPHGLDAPGHYTTADNLSVLTRYAMTKPEFRDIVKLKVVTIGKGKRKRLLHTTDELIGVYQGDIGVKTGNTNGAGYSVVSAAQRGGVTLYAIILGTKSDRQRFLDAKALLDWGFAHFRPMKLATKGTVIAEAPVSSYLDVTVPLAVSVDASIPVLDVNGKIQRTVSVAPVPAPVAVGQTVGVATFRQDKRVIATVPLIATKAIGAPNPFEAAWIGTVRVWRRIFG